MAERAHEGLAMSTLLALVVQNPVAGKVFADLVGDLKLDEFFELKIERMRTL